MTANELQAAKDRWGWSYGSGIEPNGPAIATLFDAVIDLARRVEALESSSANGEDVEDLEERVGLLERVNHQALRESREADRQEEYRKQAEADIASL